MRMSPCKDCTQRTAECHGACVSYARWKGSIPRPSAEDEEYRRYRCERNLEPIYRPMTRVRPFCEE